MSFEHFIKVLGNSFAGLRKLKTKRDLNIVAILNLVLRKQLFVGCKRTNDVFLDVKLPYSISELTDCLSPVDLAHIDWEFTLLVCRHEG